MLVLYDNNLPKNNKINKTGMYLLRNFIAMCLAK